MEFTLQNLEFCRKKPRMRIDYKKVMMKANLLDFFESVRIWFDAEGTILEICWPSPDRTRWDGSVRWSPRCPEGSARSGKNVDREGSSERKTRSAGGNLGYLGAGLSYHWGPFWLTMFDWTWFLEISPRFSTFRIFRLKVYHFIIWADGLTKSQSTSNPYKGIQRMYSKTSTMWNLCSLHCLNFALFDLPIL